jgi:hypothetical protein
LWEYRGKEGKQKKARIQREGRNTEERQEYRGKARI